MLDTNKYATEIGSIYFWYCRNLVCYTYTQKKKKKRSEAILKKIAKIALDGKPTG